MKTDIMEQCGFTELEIKKFTSFMRHKLLQNSNKGRSWTSCDIGYLKAKLVEEFSEYFVEKDTFKKREELADIANICMMLFLRLEMEY